MNKGKLDMYILIYIKNIRLILIISMNYLDFATSPDS